MVMDCFENSVKIGVLTSAGEGLFVFILNTLLPGWGTIYTGLRCAKQKYVCNNLFFGLLQSVLAWVLIGWLWSMLTGYLIWNAAKDKAEELKQEKIRFANEQAF
jgi:hypothetical protein